MLFLKDWIQLFSLEIHKQKMIILWYFGLYERLRSCRKNDQSFKTFVKSSKLKITMHTLITCWKWPTMSCESICVRLNLNFKTWKIRYNLFSLRSTLFSGMWDFCHISMKYFQTKCRADFEVWAKKKKSTTVSKISWQISF